MGCFRDWAAVVLEGVPIEDRTWKAARWMDMSRRGDSSSGIGVAAELMVRETEPIIV